VAKSRSVLAVEIGDFNEQLDYGGLLQEEEALCLNRTEFTDEEVIEGKAVGLSMLDEFGVYRVELASNAKKELMVDTKWEIGWRGRS